jgi:hypothetical protein
VRPPAVIAATPPPLRQHSRRTDSVDAMLINTTRGPRRGMR